MITYGVGVGRGSSGAAHGQLPGYCNGPVLSQVGYWVHKCSSLDFKIPYDFIFNYITYIHTGIYIQYIILYIKMLNSYQKYFTEKKACFSHM